MNKNTKLLLEFMIKEEGCTLAFSEIKAYILDLEAEEDSENDFIFEFEGVEHRIISESEIDAIALEEIENSLKECYDISEAIESAPSFLQNYIDVDWASAAAHCLSSDGYGHHFNYWNGGEENIGNYYVFRLGA